MSRALLSPEARVLLLACRPGASPDQILAVLAEPGFDWNHLAQLAQREKAITSLWQMLETLPAGVIPAERATQFSRLSLVNSFRMQHLEKRLVEVLRTLSEAGIEVVLLKGAALAVTAYGSFAARPMGDVDLLVRRSEAQRAWQLLREQGWRDMQYGQDEFYETHNHLQPLDDPSGTGLGLEIHTDITPPLHGLQLSSEMIWERAQPVELRGVRTYVPSVQDQILHLAIHFAWSHHLNSSAWRTFRDLDRIAATQQIDWDQLVSAAKQTRSRTCCYWTLSLARSLAGFPVSDSMLKALQPPRPKALLGLLERHFATTLFPASLAACPSDHVREFMWSLALAPRWSGHGQERPWNRSEAWLRASGMEGRATLGRRLVGHLANLDDWMRYLRVLFFAPRLRALAAWPLL